MKFFIVSLFIFILGCNILEDYADKNSDEALFFQGKEHLNNREFDLAIQVFNNVSNDFKQTEDFAYHYASAFGGKCGLEFIPFVEDLSDASNGLVMQILFESMPASTAVNVQACSDAEAILLARGLTAAERTDKENWLLAFIEFAKIGAILNANGDLDQDNVVDAGFDPCDINDIDDDNTKLIIIGMNIGMESLIQSISSIDSDLSGMADQYQDACNQLETFNPSYNFCNRTDAASVTANEVKGMRSVINDGTIAGLGTCSSANLALCACL